jgi:hypothetical protein
MSLLPTRIDWAGMMRIAEPLSVSSIKLGLYRKVRRPQSKAD